MTVLYIDDQLIDLYPNTVIASTFKSLSVGEISSRFASRTNRIRIPKTNNNITILGAVNEKDTSALPYTNRKCRIIIDGIPIPELTNALLSSVGDSFSLEIYSDEIGAFDTIDSSYCSDLDYGITDVIDNTFLTDYATGTTDVVNALIDYGTYNPPAVNLPGFLLNSKWESKRKPNVKEDCKAASTANIPSMSGAMTIDGVALVDGDRVLAKNQSITSQNKVYIVRAGAWETAQDFIYIGQCFDAVVRVTHGTVNAGKMFIQESLTGSMAFLSIAGGARERPWTKASIGQASAAWSSEYYNELPVTNYLQLEWPFPAIDAVSGTYSFNVTWRPNVASGSFSVAFRAYLEDDEGNLTNIFSTIGTTNSTKTTSGTVNAITKKSKILICAYRRSDNSPSFSMPFIDISSISVKVLPYVPGINSNFYFPTVRLYRAIELILTSLGSYTLEYPNDDENYYKSLVVTYSREYYGYRDRSIVITEATNINISKFVLPDIFQSDLLKEWLIRTNSLLRIQDGKYEVKPIYNIIRDKVTKNVDWTEKRVKAVDSISYRNTLAQTNYMRDDDSRDDLLEIQNKGITAIDAVQPYGTFLITDTSIPSEKKVYQSIFSSTQKANSSPYAPGDEIPFAPVWDWTSKDRFDFKNKPKLRLLSTFKTGTSKKSAYYGSTYVTSPWNVSYESQTAQAEGSEWDTHISKAFGNYIEAMQQFKLIDRYYMLDQADIANLDLFKPVFDDGSYFLIDSVNNYVPGRETKVTMLKI